MWQAKKFMESNADREVICGDALEWLNSQPILEGCSLVASMPDISEFSNMPLNGWKEWFTNTAALIMSKAPEDGVAIFYQSDIKHEGVWVDKAYLVQKAAEQQGLELLWHKIVCRVPPGIATFGKPAYSHILCFSKGVRLLDMSKSTPDVIGDLGEKTWVRGMGLENCLMISKFIASHTNTKTIVHPFCGEGSILAAANIVKLKALGIERSPKRADKARRLTISDDLKNWIE
jgi:hypothetical protein